MSSASLEVDRNAARSPLLPGWLVLLGGLIAIGPMAIDMYLPGLPAIAADLGDGSGGAELTLAGFFIGMALGQLFYGPVSDRVGRKPPLYFGLGLFVIASVACALADSLPALVGWRFLQGLGGCAGMVMARAVVRDRCSAREAARAFSALMLVMGLAPILAPMLGGWLLAFMEWRALFVVLALFGVLCLVAVHWGLTETRSPQPETDLHPGRVLGGYGRLLRQRAFLGYTLSSGLAMAGMFAYIAGSPFVLIDLYGLSPQHYGWVFGSNALGLIAASQFNVRLLRRFDLTVLLRHALWVPALAGLTLVGMLAWGPVPLPVLLLGLFAFVASLGFIAPNGSAAALASHGKQAGMASALMGSVQFALATVSSALVSVLHDGSGAPLGWVMVGCGLGALAVHRGLIRHHRLPVHE